MRRGSDSVSFFLIDGYSVLGVMTQFSDNQEAMTEDVTVLGSTWVEHDFTGLRSANISQQGFYDDAVGSIHDALNEQEGALHVLAYGIEGNTAGQRYVGYGGALQTTFDRTIAQGEFQKANAAYMGNAAVDSGVILHPHTTDTAAGDTEGASSVDNVASSANGGAAMFQVSALTLGGYTNLAVKVRHSADDVTYADLVTFAVVTTAPAAERKTVAGTVNRHLAASWAFTGAGSAQSARFFVGFART